MDHLINPFHSKEIHTSKEIDILLVEDNPGDVRLTQEVIKDSKLRNSLRVITDGREAMKFIMVVRSIDTFYLSIVKVSDALI